MNSRKYPPEMVDYVRELTARHIPNKEQIKRCMEKFKLDSITYSCFISWRCGHGIKFENRWTEEVKDFIRREIKSHSIREVAEMVKTEFKWPEMSEMLIKGALMRYNIKTGRTGRYEKGSIPANKGKVMPQWLRDKCAESWFKKGRRPPNELPIGSRVFSKEGYLMEKVRDDLGIRACDRWRPVHQLLWEKERGPIPEGYVVTFLDGDITNITIENLALVSRRVHASMTHYKLRFKNAELTKAGIAMTKLKLAINARKACLKKNKSKQRNFQKDKK